MMKKSLQRQRTKDETASPLNIHELTDIDFTDSNLNDDQVVMLSWNNGKVGSLNFLKPQK